jgi:hypothetical protein
VSADKKHILHLPVVGFDAAGYPTYKAAEPRVLTLSGTIRSAQRTAFDTTTGTLAVAGSVDMIVDDGSIDAGDTIEIYAAAGTEIAPKLSFVAKAAVENAGLIRSIAAEDGYLFVGFAKGSVVAVWRLDATSANAAPLVILEPSPGIRTNDRLEVSAGVRPTRRANGEFVVTVADGYYGKTLMYRFNPRAPNGGKATRGPTGVTLTFSKPFEGTASRYHVFRALEGPQTYQRVGETTTTTFIDTNAPQQGPLRYRVSATFASGAEAFSNEFLLR